MQPNLVVDGAANYLGGQDAYKIPCQIAENAFAAGINVTASKGGLGPRWGFERKRLNYPSGGVYDQFLNFRSYREIFESCKFQVMAPYQVGQEKYILTVMAGIVYIININTYDMQVIPITGTGLNAMSARLHWSEAGNYFVIYDYPGFPVIVENYTARHADPASMEIPVSMMGVYNQNRLFVANAGNEFTGGDPVGSLAAPDAPITFQEIMTVGSPYYGQIFQLPYGSRNDRVTSMSVLAMTDTSTGIGPLIISTPKAIFAYGTQNPRSDWEAGQFGSMIVQNAGVAGRRAITSVGSDAFFVSTDGQVRSLAMSRDEQKRWSRAPLSKEVENWLKFNDKDLSVFSFITYFNNKIFIGANPHRTPAIDFKTRMPISDYAHAGLVVMELDNVITMGETSAPTWAGLWTGVNPLDMLVTDDRCFIMSKDGGVNQLWEVNPEINYDTADQKIRYVRSRIYTREYGFKSEAGADLSFDNKELHSMDFTIGDIKGDFEIRVDYKPAHAPQYYHWKTYHYRAPWRSFNMPAQQAVGGYAPHSVRDITIGSPDETDCSPITKELYSTLKKVQLKFTISGINWSMQEYRLKAVPRLQTDVDSTCEELPIVSLFEEIFDDWAVEGFSECPEKQSLT